MDNRQPRSRGSAAKTASSGNTSGSKDLLGEIGSIVVFAAGIFTIAALLTYAPTDPSFFGGVSANAPHNACGRIGALVASLMIECFGMGAFLLPAALLFIAAAIYKREGVVRLLGTLGGMSIAVTSLTVFLSLQWKYWPFAGTLILTGGAFGAWLSQILVAQLNPLGSSIVSLVTFCVALVLSTPLSVATFGAHVLHWLLRVGHAVVLRGGRILLTYLAYLLGLLAMRLAHGAGDLLQRLIEGAARRARARAAAMQAARRDAEGAALEAAGEKGLPVLVAPEPEIGPTASKKRVPVQLDLPEPAEVPDLATATPSEAPNALPELEAAKKSRILAPQTEAPQILPPEPGQHPAGAEAAGSWEGSAGEARSTPRIGAEKRRPAAGPKPARRGQWKLPTIEFLRRPPKIESSIDKEKLIRNSEILRQKLADFDIEGQVTAVRPGPVITLYEFKPAAGVKVSRIANLVDDLSMALSAESVRILAPLPGKDVVGIEIPSESRETIFMREFLSHAEFQNNKHALPIVMGKDIGGGIYVSDLARMPHLLCAGQTGSGKSVFMNGLICSLLYRFTPDEMRFILIDPKFLEFSGYQDIPHLLLPVVDDVKQAGTALKWAVREMERRYRILALLGVKNLSSYNEKVEQMGVETVRDLLLSEENSEDEGGMASAGSAAGSDWIQAFEAGEDGAAKIGKLPYIVVIIDELADLMMQAKKEIEIPIARIAQKARAAGIHLVIATQRPSVDVITGVIKSNLPSRVSFKLASAIDSKTILDRGGADRLLGQGDMLFIPPGLSQPIRLHGAFMNDDETAKIVSFLKDQGKPAYRNEILVDEDEEGANGEGEDADDELFGDALDLVKRSGHASASYLQRHLGVGYNRAARMIETMEARGIVGPADGARPREVLIR
jgi:S-DNA-T family DNA segregation ATPase FtsK/SpoIIIE